MEDTYQLFSWQPMSQKYQPLGGSHSKFHEIWTGHGKASEVPGNSSQGLNTSGVSFLLLK